MAENSPITLGALVEHLSQMAEHAPLGTLVTINGEHVDHLSLTLQRPVARFGEGYGRVELAPDPTREQVLDLSVNGRKAPVLPVADYPFRRAMR